MLRTRRIWQEIHFHFFFHKTSCIPTNYVQLKNEDYLYGNFIIDAFIALLRLQSISTRQDLSLLFLYKFRVVRVAFMTLQHHR